MDEKFQTFKKEWCKSEGYSSFIFPNECFRKFTDIIDATDQAGKRKCRDEKENEAQRMLGLLKSARARVDRNQKILIAEESQNSSEQNFCRLAENDLTFFRKNLKSSQNTKKKLIAEHEDLKKRKGAVQRSTEKLTAGAGWAKVTLGDWQKGLITGDQKTKMISRYCKNDEKQAIALESKRKTRREEILLKQKILIDTREEIKVVELLLERTSQLNRQSRYETRDLVQTWKDALNQLNQREKEISNVEAGIDEAKKVSADKSIALSQEELKLTLQKDLNCETNNLIEELNMTLSDARNHLLKLEDTTKLKNAELLVTRKTVQIESNRLTQMRNQNRQMLLEEQDKEKALRLNFDELNLMRQKAENFKSSSSNAQERLQKVEEMIACEEKNIKIILKETSSLNSKLCHSEQQLKTLQNDEKNLVAETKALDSSVSQKKALCKNQEKERQRQTQIVYNIEYNIQNAKMRLDKMRGICEDDEEVTLLDARQNEFEKIHKEKVLSEESMKKQIRETEDHARKLSKQNEKSAAESERIHESLKEMSLSIEGGLQEQKALDQKNQEKLVERNFLQLRFSHMEKQLSYLADIGDDLQTHNNELEFEISNRLIDIKSQTKVLKSKKKSLSEERSQMIADIVERTIKIELVRTRFDLTQNLLGTNEDGATISDVEFRTQITQEKMLLLLHAYELNQRIIKAKKDEKCLLNMQNLAGFANNEFRKNVNSDNSAEGKKLSEFKRIRLESINETKLLKAKIPSLCKKIASLVSRSEVLSQELESTIDIKSKTNEALTKLKKFLVDQEVKLERAECQMRKNMQAAKRKIHDQAFFDAFESDSRSQELDDDNKLCVQRISDLAMSFHEMEEGIKERCHEKGVCLPKSTARLAQPQSFASGVSRENQSQGSSTPSSEGSIVSTYSKTSNGTSSSTKASDIPKSAHGKKLKKEAQTKKSSIRKA